MFAAALASQRSSEDAIDLAVLQALTSRGRSTVKQTAFVPFDPVNKRTVATVTDAQGRTFHYAKGAPQAIAELCQARSGHPRQVRRPGRAISPGAATGRWAWRARPTARPGRWSVCSRCRTRRGRTPRRPSPRPSKLGLAVKMVTGDDVAIGSEIAKQLGMGGHLLVASDVFKDGTDPDHIPLDAAAGGRARRRLRPRVPAAQVRDRQKPAGAGPYRRHDRRRGQRRAGA